MDAGRHVRRVPAFPLSIVAFVRALRWRATVQKEARDIDSRIHCGVVTKAPPVTAGTRIFVRGQWGCHVPVVTPPEWIGAVLRLLAAAHASCGWTVTAEPVVCGICARVVVRVRCLWSIFRTCRQNCPKKSHRGACPRGRSSRSRIVQSQRQTPVHAVGGVRYSALSERKLARIVARLGVGVKSARGLRWRGTPHARGDILRPGVWPERLPVRKQLLMKHRACHCRISRRLQHRLLKLFAKNKIPANL